MTGDVRQQLTEAAPGPPARPTWWHRLPIPGWLWGGWYRLYARVKHRFGGHTPGRVWTPYPSVGADRCTWCGRLGTPEVDR